MAYTKTTFVNGFAPAVSAEELNKIGQGIVDTENLILLKNKVGVPLGKYLSGATGFSTTNTFRPSLYNGYWFYIRYYSSYHYLEGDSPLKTFIYPLNQMVKVSSGNSNLFSLIDLNNCVFGYTMQSDQGTFLMLSQYSFSNTSSYTTVATKTSLSTKYDTQTTASGGGTKKGTQLFCVNSTSFVMYTEDGTIYSIGFPTTGANLTYSILGTLPYIPTGRSYIDFDGTYFWMIRYNLATLSFNLLKINTSGTILQTITLDTFFFDPKSDTVIADKISKKVYILKSAETNGMFEVRLT